jgi:hypothetical protein
VGVLEVVFVEVDIGVGAGVEVGVGFGVGVASELDTGGTESGWVVWDWLVREVVVVVVVVAVVVVVLVEVEVEVVEVEVVETCVGEGAWVEVGGVVVGGGRGYWVREGWTCPIFILSWASQVLFISKINWRLQISIRQLWVSFLLEFVETGFPFRIKGCFPIFCK